MIAKIRLPFDHVAILGDDRIWIAEFQPIADELNQIPFDTYLPIAEHVEDVARRFNAEILYLAKPRAADTGQIY